MAIQIHDEFSELFGTTVQSDRLESFVWIWLAQHGAFTSARDWVPELCRGMIAALLWLNRAVVEQIRRDLSSQIPERHLNWINGSDRQWVWITRYVTGSISRAGSLLDAPRPQHILLEPDFAGKMPHHLVGRNRGIAGVDYWISRIFSGLDAAIEGCSTMRAAWESHTRSDSIFAWLDDAHGERKRAFFSGAG